MSTTRLFHITATDVDGNDMSCFVEATDRADAMTHWRAWCSTVFGSGDEGADGEPIVWLVPSLTGTSGYFPWHDPEDSGHEPVLEVIE